MKKIISVTAVLLSANLAFAAAPNVNCELTYSREDANGNSLEYKSNLLKPVAMETTEVKINDVTLSVTLEPICPAGGRCSEQSNYDLTSKITKKGVSSSTSTTLTGEHDSQFLRLTVGKEDAYSNCMVQ